MNIPERHRLGSLCSLYARAAAVVVVSSMVDSIPFLSEDEEATCFFSFLRGRRWWRSDIYSF